MKSNGRNLNKKNIGNVFEKHERILFESMFNILVFMFDSFSLIFLLWILALKCFKDIYYEGLLNYYFTVFYKSCDFVLRNEAFS